MSKGIARRCAGSHRAGLAAPGSRRVFPPYLLQPQTVFQECPEKPDRADSCLAHLFSLFSFFFFLEQKKRVGTPPSREPRTGNRQTESALSLDCSPAQTARCAFNTFESDMWPAAVRFFFFPFAFRPSPISSWPSAERHFHLGNWAGAGARQADGGHGRGYDAPSPPEGADGSEGRANGSGGLARANQAHGIQIWCPVHFNGVSHPAHPLKRFLGSVLLSYYAAP